MARHCIKIRKPWSSTEESWIDVAATNNEETSFKSAQQIGIEKSNSKKYALMLHVKVLAAAEKKSSSVVSDEKGQVQLRDLEKSCRLTRLAHSRSCTYVTYNDIW